MAIYVLDASADAALTYTSSRVTALHVCSGDPTTRAEVLTQSLATAAFTGADVALANGPVDGRMSTYAAKANMTITANGTAATVALIDGTTLLEKTDIQTPQLLTAGGDVSTQAWNRIIRDAVAV